MACRRRIRHKLMLGLGVVIAIIGLLLGGTFLGLRSYQLTVRNFESKLKELKEFDELRDKIKLMNGCMLLDSNPDAADRQLLENLAAARKELKDYQQELENTILRDRALGSTDYETGSVHDLTVRLDLLEAEIHKRINAGAIQMTLGKRRSLAEMPEIKVILEELTAITEFLYKEIYKGLNNRIERSRTEYNLAAWIVGSISGGGVLLLVGLLWRFYRWVFYPIRDLSQAAGKIAQGDFDLRIEVHSGDEMEELAHAFNHMTNRLRDIYGDLARQVNERSRQLVRSERLASVGFLAAGVAHEINNPLASIVFCSEALEARLNDLLDQAQNAATGRVANSTQSKGVSAQDRETMTRYLKMVQNEAMRCKQITQRLLEFSRGGEKRREPADLNEITQGVLDTVQHLPNAKGRHIVFQPADRLTAWVNSQEIKSVVLNLVVNALDSMDEGGTLTITQRQFEGMAEMMFQDTGCGMPREVLDNIFEPFFTRSRTGKGTGLGLSISHRVITQHGGEIEASSPGVNGGSTFVVRLPLKPPAAAAQQPEENGSVESSEETYYLRKFAA